MIKLLLVEDSLSYREVIAFGLSEEPDLEIWAQFNTADAALRHLQERSDRPDLIILDLNLPGLSGIQAIPDLRKSVPQAEIIVLTESEKESDILEAIGFGAVGYLLKDSSLTTIADGIRAVVEGGASLTPSVARLVLKSAPKLSAVRDNLLSPREFEVLNLIAEGLSHKRIAERLGISQKTVEFHTARLYRKLEVPNAPAAIAKAYKIGSLSKDW